MAPIPIETAQEVSYFALAIIPSLIISLSLLSFILIKCLHKNPNNGASLIAASRTSLNTVSNPMSVHPQINTQTVIIDEPTLKELEESSKPCDSKNVSMMNLLFSNTPHSSGTLESHSVSTENILAPADSLSVPSHSPYLSKDLSSDSLQNSTVVENLNTTEEMISQDSSIQDKDPDYDEVNVAVPFAPVLGSKTPKQPNESPIGQKQKLKLTLSDDSETAKSRSTSNPANIIIDPPKLPARNLRLGSMPSNATRPTINKPVADAGEEVYESIQDENATSPISNPCSDENDENAYASVDHDKIKIVQNPPSLPAPRLPVQKETLKVSAPDQKKIRKKNRNSLRDKTEHPEPTTPNEPNDENHPLRKKTKSFAPFSKKASKKTVSSDQTQPESPHKSFEGSFEHLAKQDRGALPPLPRAVHSASSDSEEGYSCIQTAKRRESKSSTSSAEGPYSELKFDPKKKRAEEKAAEKAAAVEYTPIEDGNTSPMEIDEAYSCIDDVKSHAKDKSPVSPNEPLSDAEIAPRALPQPPTDTKIIVPHQYVKPEDIKRRKKEQRDRKEEERRMSGTELPTQNETARVEEKIEEVKENSQTEPASQFMSLKSIFSDFRKDEDIVTQTLSHVLGLPPPDPPHDSDDETQSYASVAKVLEQKRAKKPQNAPDLPIKSDAILTAEQAQSTEQIKCTDFPSGINQNESIGDHTYSTLIECQPYEEPNVVLGGESMPMYEDIHLEEKTSSTDDGTTEVISPMYEDINEGNISNVDTVVETPTYEVLSEIFDDGDEPKSKVVPIQGDRQEYETPSFENPESEVNEKVSQDLSKLREQKGYVKVSHQKENMPEYASIDDVKNAKLNAKNETNKEITQNDEIVITNEKSNDETNSVDDQKEHETSVNETNENSRQQSPEIAQDSS